MSAKLIKSKKKVKEDKILKLVEDLTKRVDKLEGKSG